MKKNQNYKYYLAASISMMTFIVYLASLKNDFVDWDDGLYIFENPHIHSFDLTFLKWAFFDFYASNWHPLTWLSHAFDYAVWGLNPFGHHLTSVILHAINTFFVTLLSIRLIDTAQGSTLQEGIRTAQNEISTLIAAGTAGFLFGLHPLHVESVAWIAERKDLLCALFFLLSIIAYIKYALHEMQESPREGSPFSPLFNKRYLFSFGFFIAALLSKPMAVTLPIVLLILDWYPLQRMKTGNALWKTIMEKLPFIALSLISSILTIIAQKSGGAIATIESLPISVRMLVAAKSLIDYLIRMALPFNLIPFYPYPRAGGVSIDGPAYLLSIVFLTGFTLLCIFLAKKQKFWLSAWSYFVITLLPVLGIMQVGSQATADRYTYLPSIGPFLIMGVAVSQTVTKVNAHKGMLIAFRVLIAAMAIFIMVSLASLTLKQIRTWRNTTVLWTHAIETSPGITNAYLNRALNFKRRGLLDEAVQDYKAAISLDSDGFIAHYNLGNIYLSEERIDESIAQYQMALHAKPGYAECHNNLGIAFNDKGWTDRAIEQYQIALALKPDYAEGHYNLGQAYITKGLLDKAIEQFKTAVYLEPNNQDFNNLLSSAYAMKNPR
jgi:protein O-mannosyl-transferase